MVVVLVAMAKVVIGRVVTQVSMAVQCVHKRCRWSRWQMNNGHINKNCHYCIYLIFLFLISTWLWTSTVKYSRFECILSVDPAHAHLDPGSRILQITDQILIFFFWFLLLLQFLIARFCLICFSSNWLEHYCRILLWSLRIWSHDFWSPHLKWLHTVIERRCVIVVWRFEMLWMYQ